MSLFGKILKNGVDYNTIIKNNIECKKVMLGNVKYFEKTDDTGGAYEFYIESGSDIITYQFENGQTWEQFASSNYNDGNIKVSYNVVYYNWTMIMDGTSMVYGSNLIANKKTYTT